MTNDSSHKDLQIATDTEIATRHYKKVHLKLYLNQNPLFYRMSFLTIPKPSKKIKKKMVKRRPCL